MCVLADATLDFWLTTGRFSDQFEKEFAQWLGVKYANLVNSGSSANLLAFMGADSAGVGGSAALKKAMKSLRLRADSPQP